MGELFRPSRAVLAEGIVTQPLDAAGVLAHRGIDGETGAWALRVADLLEARAAAFIQGASMSEVRAEAPYGVVIEDPIAHGIMAADAAIDAAQNLLAGNLDPNVQQAYYLICAADAALNEAQEALGLVDPDDELPEGEPATGDMADAMNMTEPMRAEELVLEARRGLLASAERITVDAEIRASSDGGMRIAGYAAKFMREATGLPFREQIAPGAFSRSLQSGEPVYLLVNHDTEQLPLASTGSGTLQLREDATGLYMQADLDPANPRAAELHSALSRGDVEKMSFAFTIADGGESRADGVRTLTDLNLYEVSVVTWPAYDDTEVGVRTEQPTDIDLRRRALAARLSLTK
jgi:HK97 family phage prohead protease